jgi:hypothetical protein
MINVKTKSQMNLGVQEVREPTRFQVLSRVSRGSTGTIRLAVPKAGKICADGNEIERAEVIADEEGRVTLELELEPAARIAVEERGRIRAHIRLSYAPQGGYPITKTVPLIFGWKRRRGG